MNHLTTGCMEGMGRLITHLILCNKEFGHLELYRIKKKDVHPYLMNL